MSTAAAASPMQGKVLKRAKVREYVTSFTVEGPVTVQSAYGTYSIGAGDHATFKTNVGKKICVRRKGDVITVVQPKSMNRSFVIDTIGPNSSVTMNFGAGISRTHVNKGTMVCHF